MKYLAALFDLDGTLVLTEPEYRYKIIEKVVNELNAKFSKRGADRFWFEQNRDKVIVDEFKVDPQEFWDTFRQYDSIIERAKFTTPYNDVGIIKELKSYGIKTGIVTGAPTNIMQMEVDLLGRNNFDSVVSANPRNGVKEKPNPEGLLICLDELKIKPTNAIYIGNGVEDLNAATNAGMGKRLILRRDYEFNNIDPTIQIKSLYELRSLF